MFSSDHPHHSQDVQQTAGPPPVDAMQQQPCQGFCSVLTTKDMNFIISYKYGPPCFACSAFMNPNNYPAAVQPIYPLYPCPPPAVPAVNYFNHHPPLIGPGPPPAALPWQPRPPQFGVPQLPPPPPQTPMPTDESSETGSQGRELMPVPPMIYAMHQTPVVAIPSVTGGFKKNNNPVPKSQRIPIQKSNQGVGVAPPPNIYDENVFPPLTRKVYYRQPAWKVPPYEVSLNTPAPRSLMDKNKTEVIQKSDFVIDHCNSISNQVELDKQQKESTSVDSEKEEAVEGPLNETMESKLQLKEQFETDRTSVLVENKGLLSVNTHEAAVFTEKSQLTAPKSSCDEIKKIQAYIKLDDSDLYRYVLRYVPSIKCLADLGYPLASVKNAQDKCPPINRDIMKFFERMCDRCGKKFVVFAGKQIYQETCVYHWGKTEYSQGFQISLTCCKKLPASVGCSKAKTHVWSGQPYGLNEYVTTGFPTSKTRNRVFGLDCEMCYTTQGLELVKVALVDLTGKQVYYSLVIPEHEIIDFNTRFSGVSEKDFKTCQANPFKKVRREILQMIKNDTIIIGHGLENDLRALKVIHHLVVDTSIVYRHEHGIPFRRPLREIALEVLNAKIQQGGHNPVEDASVCVGLILTKLKEDFKITFVP